MYQCQKQQSLDNNFSLTKGNFWIQADSEFSNSGIPNLASRSDETHLFCTLADAHHCLAPHQPGTQSETQSLRPHRKFAQMYANLLALVVLHCLAVVGCGCDGWLGKVRELQPHCTWTGRNYLPQNSCVSCLGPVGRDEAGWGGVEEGLKGKK